MVPRLVDPSGIAFLSWNMGLGGMVGGRDGKDNRGRRSLLPRRTSFADSGGHFGQWHRMERDEIPVNTETLRGQVLSRGTKAYIMSTGPQRTRPSALRKRIRKFVSRVLKMGGQELRVPERHRASSTIREYGKASEDASRLLMTGQIQTRA